MHFLEYECSRASGINRNPDDCEYFWRQCSRQRDKPRGVPVGKGVPRVSGINTFHQHQDRFFRLASFLPTAALSALHRATALNPPAAPCQYAADYRFARRQLRRSGSDVFFTRCWYPSFYLCSSSSCPTESTDIPALSKTLSLQQPVPLHDMSRLRWRRYHNGAHSMPDQRFRRIFPLSKIELVANNQVTERLITSSVFFSASLIVINFPRLVLPAGGDKTTRTGRYIFRRAASSSITPNPGGIIIHSP